MNTTARRHVFLAFALGTLTAGCIILLLGMATAVHADPPESWYVSPGSSGHVALAPGPPATVVPGVSPASIIANGISTSTITATISDQKSRPVADGTLVTFTTSLGEFPTAPYTRTTVTGMVTAVLTSSTMMGTATINISATTAFSNTTVQFTAGDPTTITVQVNPATQIVNSGATSTITATAFDIYGHSVPSATLSGYLLPSAMGSVSGLGMTDANGQTFGIWTPGMLIRNGTLYVTNGSVTGQAAITLTVGAPYTITLQADPTSLVVGNTSFLRAFVKDRFNNWVADGTVVSFTSSIGNVSPSTDPTSNGIAFSSINSTQAGVATITARSAPALGNATVTFGPDVPATVALQASPTSLVVGNSSVLTATVRDRYNNLVGSGIPVTFTTDLGNTVSPRNTTNGIATSSINSTVAGTAHTTATTTGAAPSSTVVTFTADAPMTITVNVNPPNLAPNSGNTAMVTATVVDRFYNPVPGRRLTGTLVPSTLGSLSSLSLTDGYGHAFGTWTAGNIVVSGRLSVTYGTRTGTSDIALLLSTPQTVSVQVVWPTLFARSGTTTLITATVRDPYNNPIPGAAVSFSLAPSTLGSDPASATTGSDGRATSTWTAGSLPGSGTVTADASSSLGSAIGSAPITLTADVPYSLTLQADPASPVTGTSSTLMATVWDRFGNLVTDGTVVTFTGDCCADLPPGSTTHGVALSQINWTGGGPVHVTATSGLATDTTTVNFGPRKVFLPIVMKNFPPIPTGTLIRINGGAANTYQIAVTLEVSASVQADYIEWMRFSNDGTNWGNWVTFAPTATWNLDPHNGLKTVYAQFAGHWGRISAPISDDILLFMNGDFSQPNLASWYPDPNILGVSSALETYTTSLTPGEIMTSPAGLLGNPTLPYNNVPIGYGKISQSFIMPSVLPGQSLVLRFNYHIYTQDRNYGPSVLYDRFEVLLNDTIVFSDMNQDPTQPIIDTGYYNLGRREATIPVTGAPGSNGNVAFRVYNRYDNNYNTYAYVDNVRLEIQGRSNNQSDEVPALPEMPAEPTGR